MLQRDYVQKLLLHQMFQLLVALKLVFTKCHKTPGPNSPLTDGVPAAGEVFLLCWDALGDQSPCSSWKL